MKADHIKREENVEINQLETKNEDRGQQICFLGEPLLSLLAFTLAPELMMVALFTEAPSKCRYLPGKLFK